MLEQTPQTPLWVSQICGARQSRESEQPGSQVFEKLQISPAGQSPLPRHTGGGEPHVETSHTSPAGQSYFDSQAVVEPSGNVPPSGSLMLPPSPA